MMTKTRPATSRAKRPKTKKAQLIRMLSAKAGADVEAISKKFGWQNHTTRAAVTGLKKAGYAVRTEKEGGRPIRYRIVANAADAGADNRPPAFETKGSPEPANAG
ncbi:MAG: DUF3489 domain-containing protein [Litoreibacter sp.]|nr:DUF3489 domain-containing protein [Paracoccaceae bacterium]NNK79507.1 DUF3489 domain-containing protein [Litoreibacter sp.]